VAKRKRNEEEQRKHEHARMWYELTKSENSYDKHNTYTDGLKRARFNSQSGIFVANGQQGQKGSDSLNAFFDEKYVTLDPHEIEHGFDIFDTDPNIKMAFNISMNAVLGGSILFSRKNKKLEKHAEQWYSNTYMDWCRKITRSIWSTGFAASVWLEDDEFVGRPVVLDLKQFDIRYWLDIYSQPHFFFVPKIGLGTANWYVPYFDEIAKPQRNLGRIPLDDVLVFIENLPTMDGDITSPILNLAADIIFEQHLYECTMAANNLNKNPVVMTQPVRENYDTDNVQSMTNPDVAATDDVVRKGETRTHANGVTTDSVSEATSIKLWIHQRTMNSTSSSDAASEEKLTNFFRKLMVNRSTQGMIPYNIPEGRQYVKQQMAIPPEHFLEFRVARQERVFTQFGVPMAMVSNQNSTGKTGLNENAIIVFRNSQKQLQQYLLRYIEEQYKAIYGPHHLIDHIKDNPDMSDSDMRNVRKLLHDSMDIVISMPGKPPPEVLDKLLSIGALKYDAYIQYQVAQYSIPMEHMHQDAPMLPLEEISMMLTGTSGVKDDPPSKVGKSAVSKSNKNHSSDAGKKQKTPEKNGSKSKASAKASKG